MGLERLRKSELRAKYGFRFVDLLEECMDNLGFTYEEFMQYNQWLDMPSYKHNLAYYTLIALTNKQFAPNFMVTSMDMMVAETILYFFKKPVDTPRRLYSTLVLLLLGYRGYPAEWEQTIEVIAEFETEAYIPFLRLLGTDYPCDTLLNLGMTMTELKQTIETIVNGLDSNPIVDSLVELYLLG